MQSEDTSASMEDTQANEKKKNHIGTWTNLQAESPLSYECYLEPTCSSLEWVLLPLMCTMVCSSTVITRCHNSGQEQGEKTFALGPGNGILRSPFTTQGHQGGQ